MDTITQKLLPFMGRKKRLEQRPAGLIPRRELPKKPRQLKSINAKNARVKAIEALGNKCAICGFSDIRALQIDHVQNNGFEERKRLYQVKLYRIVYELAVSGQATGKYQVLCANCNWIKRYESS